jgi:hypothetical protein
MKLKPNFLYILKVAGLCEHGNEPSKVGFFDTLSDNQLFKQYPAPWSE